MSKLKDWVNKELYPALFYNIDKALPEHNFELFDRGWESKTNLDGSPYNDRVGKNEVIRILRGGHILYQGREEISLIDYVIRRDSVGFRDAVKILARVVNFQLPDEDLNDGNYKKEKNQHSKTKVGLPVIQLQSKEIAKSFKESNKVNETRATFKVNEELLIKIKAIAYWERISIKDTINRALQLAVDNFLKKNKELKPIPKK